MVELVRGRDHKLYPLGLPRPAEEHDRLVGLSHVLRCRRELSFRQVQRALLDQFGVRRSLGAIFRDLHRYECDQCAPKPPAPPDPRQKARVIAWR